MFTSLFSPKNKEVISQKTGTTTGLISRIKNAVSLALGITTAASGIAMAAPSVPDTPSYTQEISVLSNPSPSRIITSESTLPPKPPALQEHKITPIEPLSAPSKLRMAVASKGESVSFFMMKNFETESGWELLVEKETGKRVRTPTRDLIAGKTYILARDENEAQTIVGIFKKQIVKKSKLSLEESKEGITSKQSPLTYEKKQSKVQWFGGVASGKDLIEKARNFLDVRYGLGGNDTNKIDCSGLLHQSMLMSGVVGDNFPRPVSGDFKKIIQKVGAKDYKKAKEGDVIYAPPSKKGGYGHVMLVSGPAIGGKIPVIHASGSHKKVVEGFVHFASNMIIGTPPWVASSKVYAEATTIKYNDIQKTSVKASQEEKKVMVAIVDSPNKEQPKTMVATVSANDSLFIAKKEQKPQLVLASLEGKNTFEQKPEAIIEKTPHPRMIELVSVGEVSNVSQSITESVIEKDVTIYAGVQKKYKAEVMNKIRNNKTIQADVRSSLLATLGESNDLRSLYKASIEKYESIMVHGTQQEKNEIKKRRTLETLYEVLSDFESKIVMAQNDAHINLKQVA